MKRLPDNQIAFYQSPDGSVNIEVDQKSTTEEFSAVQKIKNIL